MALAVGGLGACGMFAVKEQQAKIDANCLIGGRVEAERSDPAPIVVVLARKSGESWRIVDHFVLEGPGQWQFMASAATYGLVAFQDLNRDLKLQPDEPYLRSDQLVSCGTADRRTDLVLRIPAAGRRGRNETVDVAALQSRSFSEQLEFSMAQATAVGEVSYLGDPRFDEKIAEDGLWRPYDFLFKGHPGIYFLGSYDGSKIPVLFVHGINGTPQNFAPLIDRLDRSRFQPWVYYYPSGAALNSVANHLTQTMRKLQVQYGFKSFVVVAHSMGGLAARGFLLHYRATGGGATVPLFVSISTPWDGHRGAEIGVKTAPAVVRVWVDMAPGSEYLQSIYREELGIPHVLLYSTRGSDGLGLLREANDGVVSVASQLRPAARAAAASVEGFDETHMGVLAAPAVAERLNQLLAAVRAR